MASCGVRLLSSMMRCIIVFILRFASIRRTCRWMSSLPLAPPPAVAASSSLSLSVIHGTDAPSSTSRMCVCALPSERIGGMLHPYAAALFVAHHRAGTTEQRFALEPANHLVRSALREGKKGVKIARCHSDLPLLLSVHPCQSLTPFVESRSQNASRVPAIRTGR
jgi:hypothetical protein